VRLVAFVLYGITLLVSYNTAIENDGPSFETIITFIGRCGREGEGGERQREIWMDGFAVPSSSTHKFSYIHYIPMCVMFITLQTSTQCSVSFHVH
jgi:hypothetical protein